MPITAVPPPSDPIHTITTTTNNTNINNHNHNNDTRGIASCLTEVGHHRPSPTERCYEMTSSAFPQVSGEARIANRKTNARHREGGPVAWGRTQDRPVASRLDRPAVLSQSSLSMVSALIACCSLSAHLGYLQGVPRPCLFSCLHPWKFRHDGLPNTQRQHVRSSVRRPPLFGTT